MRISRIVFENHRVLPDLDFEVRDHLVLVGPNASGKTSLLRALDVVIGGTLGQLANAFPMDALRDPTKPLRVEVQFDSLTDAESGALCDEANVTESDGVESTTVTLAVQVEFDGDEPDVSRVFRKPGEDRLARREHRAVIGWGFLPATRSPERELGANRLSALRTLLSSIEIGEKKEQRIAKLLADANKLIDTAVPVVRLRTELANELTGVLPRPVAPSDLAVQITAATDDDPSSQAELHLRDHTGEPAPLHHQSDGLRALSTIVVQRLATPASILAIDEPEIHLHPRSQARLGHLLATGDGQRLVATHASSVLSAFSPADVVAITPDTIRQLEREALEEQPKFFAQWWNDAAVEPLTARTVVLVEGPSDRILLESVARHVGNDLDHLDCSVVIAQGAPGFRPLLKLYGQPGFGLDVVGLVDLDEVPLVAVALNVDGDEASVRAAGFEISDPDLEGECIHGLGVSRHVTLMCESGLYQRRQILGSQRVERASELDEVKYTEWCRRDKVRHALALTSTMEAKDARRIASLARLVRSVASR